jgi:glycerol kinase
MAEGCFIGIDQGSSSTKAVAVGSNGQMLVSIRRDLKPPFREGDRVEHDPMEIVRSIQESVTETAEAIRPTGTPLLGIGLSCQRSSCLAWDESTGEPRSPVISWRDTRGKDLIHALAEHAPRVFTLSGLPLTPYYSASKFRWLLDNIPAVTVRRGHRNAQLLPHPRLTGVPQDRIDHTHAARTQLMNISTLAWDGDLLKLFGLTGIRLPEITPSAHEFRTTATPADPSRSSPRSAISEALLGLGVVGQGDAGINYGTGGFLMVNTGAGLLTAGGLMASVHYSIDAERQYLIEGSVNAVGDALEWARTRLGLFREYGEVDDLCWKAATDVIAFIGLNGTGAPHWETDIPSAFHGLRPESSSADMVRAVVEGIVFFMKDIAEAAVKTGIRPRSFVLAGGLSSLTYLAQAQADILGTDVRIGAAQEASAMGAAFLAGMRHGTWTAEDIKRLTSGGENVKGEANPGLERRYRKWMELHRMTRELSS